MPAPIASWMPAFTAGMYSFGILPPTIWSANSYPAPGSCGSRLISTSPYWPEPPVWRTNRPRTFIVGCEIVSR